MKKAFRKKPPGKWEPGQHPVTYGPEPFKVEVISCHPQLVELRFIRDGFEATGFLPLPDLKALHQRLGELIAPFEASLDRLAGGSAAAGGDQP